MLDLDPFKLLGCTEALSALVSIRPRGSTHGVGHAHLDLRCVLPLLRFLEFLDEWSQLVLGHMGAPSNAPSQPSSSSVKADLF